MTGSSIRVLCYNIRHAQGIGGIISNARIARVITDAECDLVGLTEVWRFAERLDQPVILGKLTSLDATFHPLHRTMGREAGNALLTSLPVEEVRFVALPSRREPRGCMIARVLLGSEPIAFAVTHLSLHRATRALQVAALAEKLPRDLPLVLVGDFNCPPDELSGLSEILSVPNDIPPTYPSPFPFRALDQVTYSGHWSLESLEARRSWASDHLPMIAELSLRG